MTPQEAIDYIESYTWSTTKLGLERTQALLHALGDPQKKLKFIQQNYTVQEYAEIVSSDELLQAMNLNLSLMGDLKYKVAIGPGTDTPQYRDNLRNDLMMLVQAGALSMLDYVQMINEPYAAEIERRIQQHQAEQAALAAAGVPAEEPTAE